MMLFKKICIPIGCRLWHRSLKLSAAALIVQFLPKSFHWKLLRSAIVWKFCFVKWKSV